MPVRVPAPMISLVLSAVMLLQYPYPGQAPQRQSNSVKAPADTEAVATFTGTFKSADKKFLMLDVENGNTMRMYITGATKFFRDKRPAKSSDFHTGEPVSVEASSDNRLNLLAVRVTAVPSKPDKKAPEAEHER